MQRDVEVQVDSIDKGGTFLGSLYAPSLKPQSNVGIALLAAGLAKLHPSFVPSRVPGGDLLQAAQDAAQAARLKVWEGYVEEEAPAALEEGGPEAAVANGAAPAEKVTVTEVMPRPPEGGQSVPVWTLPSLSAFLPRCTVPLQPISWHLHPLLCISLQGTGSACFNL